MNGRPARTTDEDREFNRLLGQRLRALREARGWSLAQVEEKSGGVWLAVVIGSYERGDRALTAARLAKVADFYGADLLELLCGPDPRLERLHREAAVGRHFLAAMALAGGGES